MTQPQKIKFLEALWIICWEKKKERKNINQTLNYFLKKLTSKNCTNTSLCFTCSTTCIKKTHSTEYYSPSSENQTKLELADRGHEEYV